MTFRSALGAVLALLLVGCGPGGPELPEARLWPAPRVDPPAAAFLTARPALSDLSSWSAGGCGASQPAEARLLGDFGVGNGRVFALSGYACPPNTLHTMIGPNYQKDDVFCPDTATRLRLSGEEASQVEGRVFRLRHAPVLLMRERFRDLDLISLTFAPLLSNSAPQIGHAILRALIVRHRGDGPVASGVHLVTDSGTTACGNRLRRLVLLSPAGHVAVEDIAVGPLEPGQEKVFWLAYLLGFDEAGLDEAEATMRSSDPDVLLAETLVNWENWFARATRLESPDPRVTDLLAGLLVTVRSQQTFAGGVSPMSEYTRLWTRDLVGPLRLYAALGLHDEAQAMLEYYHLAAAAGGDISNSLPLDVDPAAPPPEPDWAALPPFEGREAAEAPGYLPLMARWLALASGSHALVERHWAFFERALAGQSFDAAGLQPFSTDETFRTAMAFAHGLDLREPFAEPYRSVNSAFVFAAAAEALAAEAEAVGRTEAAARWTAAAAASRAAQAAYWRPQGGWAPYLRTDDPEAIPPLFEDVSTQPVWLGERRADNPFALENLERLVAELGRGGGIICSPPHPDYRGQNLLGIAVEQGIYTGMNPGYALYNLAAADHPEAPAAFDAAGALASPSGNYCEYCVLDDAGALQILYDPSGELGDYTARYRPWEGGIVGEALVFFLTGFAPDAQAATVSLAPRLPNDWPWMRWRDLRVGESRFDLEVTRPALSARRVRLTLTSGPPLTVRLSFPLDAAVDVTEVRLSGRTLGPDEYAARSLIGPVRVHLPDAPLTPAAPLEASVRWEE